MRLFRLATFAAGLMVTTFAHAQFVSHSYPVGSVGGSQALVADFNHDGYPDLAVYGSGPLSVSLNDGKGGFRPPQLLTPPQGSTAVWAPLIAIADFNGDGRPDIAACTFTNTRAPAYSLTLFLNDGNGGFKASQTVALYVPCAGLAAGDENLDGKADVVVGASGGAVMSDIITTYFGNGRGSIGNPISQNIYLGARDGQITNCTISNLLGGDLNGDGKFGLLLFGDCSAGPTNGGTVYRGTSTGKNPYFALAEVQEGFRSYDLAPYLFDLNHDGRLDLITTDHQTGPHDSQDYNLDFATNQGSSFAFQPVWNENSYAAPFGNTILAGAAADFNGDGILDAVVGVYESPDGGASPGNYYLLLLNGSNAGKYSVANRWDLGKQVPPSFVIAGDFNLDGKTDFVAITEGNGTSNITDIVVYLNQTASSGCSVPPAPGVHVCPPIAGQIYTSPVHVAGASRGASGTVNHMELWIDGKKISNYPGNQIDISVSLKSGHHAATLIEVDSKNAYLKSAPVGFTVK